MNGPEIAAAVLGIVLMVALLQLWRPGTFRGLVRRRQPTVMVTVRVDAGPFRRSIEEARLSVEEIDRRCRVSAAASRSRRGVE